MTAVAQALAADGPPTTAGVKAVSFSGQDDFERFLTGDGFTRQS
jgi:hypothetical protein